MNLASGGRSRDLIVTAAASLVSLVLVAMPFGGLVKGIVLLPMVLVLPGYALVAAVSPPGTLSRGERAVHTVALSVSAAALGGLVWQFAFVLSREAWAVLLTSITLAGCAIAQRRRTRQTPIREQNRPRPPRASPGDSRLSRIELPTALTALIGVAAAIAAIVIAVDGLQEQRAESHFSALWVVPPKPNSDAVEVGILNHQGAAHEYRLEVKASGREIQDWQGRIDSHGRKRLLLGPGTVPPGARVVISLYRDGVLYRRTEMQTEIEA
ncbi:MAG: hypothetical protein QOF85_1555 [Solirubrobacterales bacterium]|jgi:uncharacterized membrane protein|nr:hypothetical protein [Solirubrobacterales bacterium]